MKDVRVDLTAGQVLRVFTTSPTTLAGKVNASKRSATLTASGTYVDPVPPPPAGLPPDTTLRYIPHTIPALPGIGVKTPTGLGTDYMRVGMPGQRHAYAKTQPFSAPAPGYPQGRWLLMTYGGVLLDGNTYAYVKTLGSLPGNAVWDPKDPNVMYGAWNDDRGLKRLDVTGGMTTIFDPGVPINLGLSEGDISDTGIVAVCNLAGTHVWTYDVWNRTTVGSFDIGGAADNMTMSHDGRFMVVDFGSHADGTGPGKGAWVWNVDGSNGKQILNVSRHADTGVSVAGRHVWITCSPFASYVDLETGVQTKLAIPDPNAYSQGHVSGRGAPGDVLFTDYIGSGTKAGADQVAVARLDTSGSVRLYAFGNSSTPSYANQPQGILSRDSTRAVYASAHGAGGPFCFVAGML